MHSRVSSPASHDSNRLPQEGAECVFDAFLYSKGILLDLPAVEGSTVVAQLKKVPIYRLVHAGAKILFPINSPEEFCFLDIPE